LQLQPDLVVAWYSGSRSIDLTWLDRRGIPVYRSEPRLLSQIPKGLRKLGTLAGTSAQAQISADQLERDLASVCHTRSPPRTAFYQLWDSPALTYGGHHWANDALARTGFSNVFADIERSVFSPAKEAILVRAPDAVLAAALTKVDPRIATRVIRVPASWDRPTPRILSALRQLCRAVEEMEQ
jgi:iron complex transport system substrate-binding protein